MFKFTSRLTSTVARAHAAERKSGNETRLSPEVGDLFQLSEYAIFERGRVKKTYIRVIVLVKCTELKCQTVTVCEPRYS